MIKIVFLFIVCSLAFVLLVYMEIPLRLDKFRGFPFQLFKELIYSIQACTYQREQQN